LITIDIELPDITGLELLNRFCQLEQKNGIAPAKKIMVTAHSNVDYVVKAKDKCDAFVVKPLRKATLLDKIKELCPPQSGPS
jgi:FixJ family two-component response regulator